MAAVREQDRDQLSRRDAERAARSYCREDLPVRRLTHAPEDAAAFRVGVLTKKDQSKLDSVLASSTSPVHRLRTERTAVADRLPPSATAATRLQPSRCPDGSGTIVLLGALIGIPLVLVGYIALVEVTSVGWRRGLQGAARPLLWLMPASVRARSSSTRRYTIALACTTRLATRRPPTSWASSRPTRRSSPCATRDLAGPAHRDRRGRACVRRAVDRVRYESAAKL